MFMWTSSRSIGQIELAPVYFRFDFQQPGFDRIAFPGSEDAGLLQRLGVGDRSPDVMTIQPPVERDGLAVALHGGRRVRSGNVLST